MKKSVRRRHNKDGSVTTTRIYSHKNIFGTRVYDTYSTRSEPKEKKKPIIIKTSNSVAFIISTSLFFLICILSVEFHWNAITFRIIVGLILISLVVFMLLNNNPILRYWIINLILKKTKAGKDENTTGGKYEQKKAD